MSKDNVIEYPLATEKSIKLMESENKLIFVVTRTANKQQIKQSIEEEFDVKITDVKTLMDTKGRKKAYVKFSMETPAIDIATKLGLM
ncbi:50S ribosomal protein L23 [Candidatus Woesearchaeota archaeon]|nr:50S ribosomal protein L23 [Candidatus Woesearchaeota archaeon]